MSRARGHQVRQSIPWWSKPAAGLLYPTATTRFVVEAITAPTWSREHSDRFAMVAAMLIQVSSHEGRCRLLTHLRLLVVLLFIVYVRRESRGVPPCRCRISVWKIGVSDVT